MAVYPYISVIIPTYNRSELLALTLNSFISQTYPCENFEIIIVDNNSVDNTRELSNKYVNNSKVEVKYIFEKRQGVHYARNSAAMQARGDIFYFTDDDMIADPDLLINLVQLFSYNPKIGCVTGRILPRFEVSPPKWVEKYLINAYLSLTDRDRPEQLVISINDTMVFSCHQGIKRDVFFNAGGFNPENTAGIWIGDGETGLNIKIKALGYLFAYTSTSVIYHMIPSERMTLSYLVRRIGNQGYCDSYTEYRQHRKKDKILQLLFVRITIGAAKMFMLTLGAIMLGRESWHFIPARITYLYKQIVYDLKLYFDKDFRRVVEIDDWLANEDEKIEF